MSSLIGCKFANAVIAYNYDRQFDIMYISLKSIPIEAYGEETVTDFIVRKDFTNQEPVGLTILNFSKYSETTLRDVVETLFTTLAEETQKGIWKLRSGRQY